MARLLKVGVAGLVALIAVFVYLRGREGVPPAPSDAGGTLVASLRSEPTSYNRYVEPTAAADLVSLLTDGRLLRVNRATDEMEPALAESWTSSPDGLSHILTLRQGVRFSDGQPFTSADVLFSARVMYDTGVNSAIGNATRVAGQPLTFEADGPTRVRVLMPAKFAPGLRLLDHMPILPRHRLEEAFAKGTFRETWKAGTPPAEVTGLGPFVLAEHTAGQRLVFRRNPHYWKRDGEGRPLPYLDSLVVLIIPDQNAEALRLESGEVDLMSNADIRPDDYATFKRAASGGRMRLVDVGVGLDPNLLWFNLSKTSRADAPWIRQTAFRQGVSHAVNRQAIADTVYLGAAVPLYGPVSPGNRTWYSAAAPQTPFDQARARQLFASVGLVDRNGDGTLDDSGGKPVRFSILTQKGHTLRERTASMVQEHLRQVGVTVDLVLLDVGTVRQRWAEGNYDSVYLGVQASSTDPSLNPEFWMSSGTFHFWNPMQPAPATPWEAAMDEAMRKMAVAGTLAERQQLFAEVQRIFGEQLPGVYFVAPRVMAAIGPRVENATPVLQAPQILWNAETLSVKR